MRLVDEKRALSEISDLRKSRKTFDGFGTQQDGIDADKAKIEELRNKLDNSEYKGLQERYTAIQTELDDINKELDSVNSSRDKLYDERNRLNEEVNVLWGRKKESAANFKEANDKYCEHGLNVVTRYATSNLAILSLFQSLASMTNAPNELRDSRLNVARTRTRSAKRSMKGCLKKLECPPLLWRLKTVPHSSTTFLASLVLRRPVSQNQSCLPCLPHLQHLPMFRN